MDPLVQLLEPLVSKRSSSDSSPLTRREVVEALMRTPCNRELRFQGVNLQGADLSRLDLRHINFK